VNERWKRDSRSDSTSTHLWWQSRSIKLPNTWRATEGILFFVREAPMAKLLLLSLFDSQSWITNQHPEAFGESGNGTLSIVRRDIVYGNTFSTLKTQVDHLRDTLKGTVARFEVEVCSPVI
jgi:hypothetical protein